VVQCGRAGLDLQARPFLAHDEVMSIGTVFALVAALGYGPSDFVGGPARAERVLVDRGLAGQLAGTFPKLALACPCQAGPSRSASHER
jgi:hypothetical protein